MGFVVDECLVGLETAHDLAEILATDDADGFKTATDELGLAHQVCKSHVKRNTEALIESLESAVRGNADGSLTATGVTPEEAVGDLGRLGELIVSRRPEEGSKLARRWCAGASPRRTQRRARFRRWGFHP
ncbi:MAG: hypothetical protein JXA14_06145, partial [Anaerolineae bacterium]|nr:hypothetical protein [Anaerolineae bacterium]